MAAAPTERHKLFDVVEMEIAKRFILIPVPSSTSKYKQ